MKVMLYIVVLIQFGAICVGGFRYRSLPQPLRLLEYLLVFAFIMTIIEWILASQSINTLWAAHISTIVEFVIVLIIFSFWMRHDLSRLVSFGCLIGFIIFWIISKLLFEPFSQFDGWTAAVSKIIQITFSSILFVEVIKDSDIDWTKDPRFWVAAGIIIYSAGSLFLFALFNKMLLISPDRLKFVWSLNWIFSIISNLLFARAFLCKK
jgi:hypothetical protein